MSKEQEEAWIENGLIDNIRIRWIIRDLGKRSPVFVTQLEYTNKPKNRNTILRWDGAHENYHIDIYGSRGQHLKKETRRSTLPSVSEQVDIVFKDLEGNLSKILDKKFHAALLGDIANEAKAFQDRLSAIKEAITNQVSTNKQLKLGAIHWGQHLRTKANIRASIRTKINDELNYQKEKGGKC